MIYFIRFSNPILPGVLFRRLECHTLIAAWRSNVMNGLLILTLGVGLALSASASADPERIGFPPDYPDGFTQYTIHNRDDTKQVRYLHANEIALQGAREGDTLPNGSVLVMEIHKAVLDADGVPVTGEDGFFEKDQLALYALMEKRAGWGDDYPLEIRNGDWNYAFFLPDGTRKPDVDETECMACHKPHAANDFLFTLDELQAKARAAD